eukprot:scaffold129841_cov30-Prasinocladus_malaysianus.AAC.1
MGHRLFVLHGPHPLPVDYTLRVRSKRSLLVGPDHHTWSRTEHHTQPRRVCKVTMEPSAYICEWSVQGTIPYFSPRNPDHGFALVYKAYVHEAMKSKYLAALQQESSLLLL